MVVKRRITRISAYYDYYNLHDTLNIQFTPLRAKTIFRFTGCAQK